MTKKRIGILTDGGDCPGLNAVIRGIAKSAINQHDMEVIGFLDGFLGLVERKTIVLDNDRVSGILTQGGTILGTTNRADPFAHVVDGTTKDLSDACVAYYQELGLSALICLGGDGTQSIARRFSDKGMHVIGVPKTIDKDVYGTDETFGFDSARALCTDAIDRLHSTASAHQRVMLVEVMGRNAGWLALESCIAGGGDICLIPEIPFEPKAIFTALERRQRQGKRFSIIVVAEGAHPAGGEQTYLNEPMRPSNPIRLGGCSHLIGSVIERATKMECRVTVLGHLQRGGAPTAYDRFLATRFAIQAMDMIQRGDFNCMVALRDGKMTSVPIDEVAGKQRVVPLDHSVLQVAREVGTRFGAPNELA